MNLQPVLNKLYPEGSYGGQCGAFCHKLVEANAKFPLLGTWLSTKQAQLKQSGFPHPETLRVGDVVLFNYAPFGHLALINNIIGSRIQLTESNYNYDFRVHHTRQVESSDPHILGVWRGDLLFSQVIQVKLVQNGIPWPSMNEKFTDIRNRLQTASNKFLDINIDVDYINYPIPITPVGYPVPFVGADLTWYANNILPHKGDYNVVCLLSDRTPEMGQTFGWHSGEGQLQVYSNETETITFNDFGTVNYFVHAAIHELCHYLCEGQPDLVHQYFNDSHLPNNNDPRYGLFDLAGFIKTL